MSICLVLTAALLLGYVVKPQEKAVVTAPDTVSEVRSGTGYVLKEYKGRLAIFKDNSDIPFEVFDIFTSTLPQSDRELLKDGISAKSETELLKLVSDYTS